MKISIITATYNSAETLRDTMESLLRQTYDNYEYIVVDDVVQPSSDASCKEASIAIYGGCYTLGNKACREDKP